MNKIQQQHYLKRESLANMELDFFFEVIFKRLGQELELLRNTLFDYRDENGNERKPTVYEEIFGLNEQAWVGVLNNAIVRAFPDTANTLLEFTIYNKTEFQGRADLLVQWKNSKGKKINLLFEAKQYKESDETKMKEDATSYINEIMKQGKGYIDADKEYFDKKENLFIVPIVFAWIPEDNLLKIADDYMKPSNEKKEDFCSLYSECNSGAWVYGSVYTSKGKKLK
ncbi:MAG: hypothetical protein K9G36_05320 [Crocinitomicaceae bacterium]|nr:hypothetical protein [Crocinitomicaceae bacterium]MCF8410317.1 hypothetical protein [Crocinitomicaceae bacterium]MCF8444198.1 hypothetical protein [Crocinitomicaceae bacterium]